MLFVFLYLGDQCAVDTSLCVVHAWTLGSNPIYPIERRESSILQIGIMHRAPLSFKRPD